MKTIMHTDIHKTTFQLLLILFFSIIISCDNNNHALEENKQLETKLSTDLVYNPRTLQNNDTAQLSALGKLSFVDSVHQFGIIQEGEVLSYEFQFSNTGKKDILIVEAKASCGCTVPDYPKYPIKSGEKNNIKITFDSKGKAGMNEKEITLITNGNPAVYHLFIQAQVNAKK